MVATENWCVRVANRTYGPYSLAQMRKFAQEGRLARHSQVSHAGSTTWRDAASDATLSRLFKSAGAEATFGRRSDQPSDVDPSSGQSENCYLMIFDVVAATATRIESQVRAFGPALRVADNVWLVSSSLTATGLRNAIATHVTPREFIFVTELERGGFAWQNFGPEIQSKLREMLQPVMKRAAAN